MAQEFLASFGVQIDESGLNRLQQAMKDNRQLAEELAAAFDRARKEVEAFFRDLSGMSFSSPDLSASARTSEEQSSFSLPLSLDFSKATQELSAFFKTASKSFKLNADASAVVSAGRNALSQLQSLFASTVLPLQASLTVTETKTQTVTPEPAARNNSTNTVNMVSQRTAPTQQIYQSSAGGRFNAPATTEVAEDGDPEYVIPVKKESLAVPLLRQLFDELSESAKDTLRKSLETNESGEMERGAGTLSGLPELFSAAKEASSAVVHQNTTHNVSAPVSIQVEAAGSDPEAVGRSVYDVAEQYLLRTLKTYG